MSEGARAPTGDRSLRPLVSAAYVGRQVSGLKLYTDVDLAELPNVEATVDQIHLHLLYSHAVAIPDPLRYLADKLPAKPGRAVAPAIRQRFVHYLHFLAYLRPLIQAGVVILLEDDLVAPGGDSLLLDRLYDEVADHGDLTDFINARMGLHGVAARQAARDLATSERPILDLVVSDAIDGVMAGLEVSAKHDHQLDLFLPYRFYRQILQYVAAENPARFADWRSYLDRDKKWAAPVQSGRPDESLMVAELAALDIADFDLSPRDVLAVRRGDEFEAWRRTLRDALLEVQTLRSADALGATDAHRAVAERLTVGKIELEQRISKSRFLARAQSGGKAFVLGALAAVGLNWFVPAGEDVVKAAAAGLVTSAWDVLSTRPKPADAALLQHYLQFTPLE